MRKTQEHMQPLWDMPLDELVKKAIDHVCELSSGKRRWMMCVPPQWDDSDELLIGTIERLHQKIKELEESINSAR